MGGSLTLQPPIASLPATYFPPPSPLPSLYYRYLKSPLSLDHVAGLSLWVSKQFSCLTINLKHVSFVIPAAATPDDRPAHTNKLTLGFRTLTYYSKPPHDFYQGRFYALFYALTERVLGHERYGDTLQDRVKLQQCLECRVLQMCVLFLFLFYRALLRKDW